MKPERFGFRGVMMLQNDPVLESKLKAMRNRNLNPPFFILPIMPEATGSMTQKDFDTVFVSIPKNGTWRFVPGGEYICVAMTDDSDVLLFEQILVETKYPYELFTQ